MSVATSRQHMTGCENLSAQQGPYPRRNQRPIMTFTLTSGSSFPVSDNYENATPCVTRFVSWSFDVCGRLMHLASRRPSACVRPMNIKLFRSDTQHTHKKQGSKMAPQYPDAFRLSVARMNVRFLFEAIEQGAYPDERQELAVHASPRPEDAGRRQQAYTHGADLTKGRRTSHTNHA